MDDEIKQSLESQDERLAGLIESQNKTISILEKRFDDIKWYFGGAATLFTLVFAVLSIVLAMKNDSEVEGLRQFKQELREDIGKSTAQSDVELLGLNGSQLSGQDLRATSSRDTDGKLKINIALVLRNRGEGETGDIWMKMYSREPVHQEHISTDEPTYQFEGSVEPANMHPRSLPGHYSNEYFFHYTLASEQPILAGRYPALLKVYYGKGKSTLSSVTLVVESDPGK